MNIGLLDLVWIATIILVVASWLIFLTLIIRRFLAEKSHAHNQLLLKSTQRKIFWLLEMDEPAFAQALNTRKVFNEMEVEKLSTICIRLCQILKGHEKEQVIRIMLKTGFDQDCLEDLQKGNENARHAAAIALQYFKDKATKKALLKALDDESNEVCFAAANSLFERNALPDIEVLAKQLEFRNFLKSIECRNLFRQIAIKSPGVLLKLIRQKQISDPLKILLAESLGHASSLEVVSKLLTLALDENPEVRISALKSLARLEHPDAEDVVLRNLQHERWEVQIAAINAAGEIPIESALPALEQLLDADNWLLRFRAAENLLKLGNTGRLVLLGKTGSGDTAGRMAGLILNENKRQTILAV